MFISQYHSVRDPSGRKGKNWQLHVEKGRSSTKYEPLFPHFHFRVLTFACPSRFFFIRKVYLDPLRFPFLHPGSASSPSAPASLAGFLCKKKLTAPLKSAAMTRLRDANYALWAKQGGDWGIVHSTITESLPFNKQIWMHQLYCLCYYVQLLLFCCANWRSYVEKRRCGTLLYIISL